MKLKLQQLVIPAIAMALPAGFIGVTPAGAEPSRDVAALSQTGAAVIESIRLSGEGEASEAVIKLSAPATYTSFQTTSPLRLIIDLSQTSLTEAAKRPFSGGGNFKGMTVNSHATESGVLSRVTFDLRNNIVPVIKSTAREIRISFPRQPAPEAPGKVAESAQKAMPASTERAVPPPPAPVTPAAEKVSSEQAAPASAAPQKRILRSITSRKGAILLAIDGGAPEYKVFRLNNPERMVLDLPGVTNDIAARIVPLNTAGIASARLGLYPDKVRVVLDAFNGSFPESRVVMTDEGIMLIEARGNTAEQSALLAERKQAETLAAGKAAEKQLSQEQKATAEKAAQEKLAAAEKAAEEKAATLQKPVKPPVGATLPKASVKSPVQPASEKKQIASAGPVQVEAIDFQVTGNISRLSIKVPGDAAIEPLLASSGFVTLTIKNCSLPKHLQRSLETRKFVSPVLRVTPMAIKTGKGTDTLIRIAMRAPAAHELRREGDMLYVEFTHPQEALRDSISSDLQEASPLAGKPARAVAAQPQETELGTELSAPFEPAAPKPAGLAKTYKGRKVTLEFADAEVRKIFQLLSEVSNKNFVLGDDVTGTISIKLVNVPWDQALDIILDTKGLDKREEGNIIIIRAKGKFKSLADEELEIKKTLYKSIELKTETFNVNYADLTGIVAQFNALKTERGTISPDTRTNKIIVKDIPLALDDMRKLLVQLDIPERQVMIEARIVEATSTFTRNLGVSWGVHYRDSGASFLGINQLDTGFGGLTSPPPTSGPGTSAGGNMGISFGTLGSNVQLDMRLNAAASAGMIKIVSTPKVATLNNKTAKITQGQQIPYTTSTSDKIETKFIEAALSLEVTPHINANGTIGMKIDAKNDSPGTNSSGGAPPINKKQATTEMLLRDGETTVIGGIYVDSDTESDDGVPFLMDIPLVGKLFKTNNKSKSKSELLVFITPRILGSVQ